MGRRKARAVKLPPLNKKLNSARNRILYRTLSDLAPVRDFMADMGERVDGGKWLGLGFGLLFLTVISTGIAFASGFNWEPDEIPASRWQERISTRQWVMAFSMVIPAASAAAAAASMFALPRSPLRVVAASVVAALALVAFLFSWSLGIDAVNSAKYWAEHSPSRLPF